MGEIWSKRCEGVGITWASSSVHSWDVESSVVVTLHLIVWADCDSTLLLGSTSVGRLLSFPS